jgi:hypothetical protein
MNLSVGASIAGVPAVTLDALIDKYTREFGDRIDPDVIRYVVHDSHDRLMEHVPRTLYIYLGAWVRHRLERRAVSRPEPTLTEILLAPVNRL